MVSAPPPEGPTPPSPLLEPGEATTAETVESLRHAIEVQEAHVRLLRARKVAREELLHRLRSLLSTGDALEAHNDVRHVVRQAEENLEHLVRTEGAVASIESSGCSGAVAVGSSTAAEVDPMARVFSSAVEAQLAAVEDVRVVTHSASVDPFSEEQRARQHHKKGGNQRRLKAERDQQQQRQASAVNVHADPQDGEVVVPPPPGVTHSAATTALLVQSAAREAAGRAAMLAALESLQRALDTHSGASVSSSEPAWLRDDAEEVVEEEEKSDGDEEGQPTVEDVPNLAEHSSSSAASTAEYSDDFEQRSASTATSVAAPKELQDEDEASHELP